MSETRKLVVIGILLGGMVLGYQIYQNYIAFPSNDDSIMRMSDTEWRRQWEAERAK
jgi:hypothetical protein